MSSNFAQPTSSSSSKELERPKPTPRRTTSLLVPSSSRPASPSKIPSRPPSRSATNTVPVTPKKPVRRLTVGQSSGIPVPVGSSPFKFSKPRASTAAVTSAVVAAQTRSASPSDSIISDTAVASLTRSRSKGSRPPSFVGSSPNQTGGIPDMSHDSIIDLDLNNSEPTKPGTLVDSTEHPDLPSSNTIATGESAKHTDVFNHASETSGNLLFHPDPQGEGHGNGGANEHTTGDSLSRAEAASNQGQDEKILSVEQLDKKDADEQPQARDETKQDRPLEAEPEGEVQEGLTFKITSDQDAEDGAFEGIKEDANLGPSPEVQNKIPANVENQPEPETLAMGITAADAPPPRSSAKDPQAPNIPTVVMTAALPSSTAERQIEHASLSQSVNDQPASDEKDIQPETPSRAPTPETPARLETPGTSRSQSPKPSKGGLTRVDSYRPVLSPVVDSPIDGRANQPPTPQIPRILPNSKSAAEVTPSTPSPLARDRAPKNSEENVRGATETGGTSTDPTANALASITSHTPSGGPTSREPGESNGTARADSNDNDENKPKLPQIPPLPNPAELMNKFPGPIDKKLADHLNKPDTPVGEINAIWNTWLNFYSLIALKTLVVEPAAQRYDLHDRLTPDIVLYPFPTGESGSSGTNSMSDPDAEPTNKWQIVYYGNPGVNDFSTASILPPSAERWKVAVDMVQYICDVQRQKPTWAIITIGSWVRFYAFQGGKIGVPACFLLGQSGGVCIPISLPGQPDPEPTQPFTNSIISVNIGNREHGLVFKVGIPMIFMAYLLLEGLPSFPFPPKLLPWKPEFLPV